MRLHEAESLLGVIISLKETRAKSLLNDLSKDALAKAIISRIANSIFGPTGTDTPTWAEKNPEPSRPKESMETRRQQTNARQVALSEDSGMDCRYDLEHKNKAEYMIQRI